MPELPDVTVYVEAMRQRIVGSALERVRIISPFVLRTFEPPVEAVEGRRVLGVSRLGKRIVLGLEGDLFVVLLRPAGGPSVRVDGGIKGHAATSLVNNI